ncbi:uncharacterized protein LOC125228213 isoform X2 [Leguminivora glycinivorella]|uniref:uncharacterized protein LOC125228213 isoform X2 n=1 Tax=Leguminivora glycinivorella TaxID=1035111 RepID=UPI00200C3EE5|nr:uncharacterized protein LOC125228213 isoform X2 [Leguminivora glycinivorella]
MYSMKNIITHDGDILLPKCMYNMKNLYNFDTTADSTEDEININVRNQMPSKEMAELEVRQDQLLKKLDLLYDRIKTISSFCNVDPTKFSKSSIKKPVFIEIPEEIILVYSPDCLPWFLKKIVKESSHPVNVSWHIHSSVPTEKVPKIQAFVKSLPKQGLVSKVTIRLIFKNVSADPELKWSSLDMPIVGNVNILRYVSLAYPSIIPYDSDDYNVDNLLDICHLLERTPEKSKETLTKKLFSQSKIWIYNNEFSIVDAAAYNVIKQWQNGSKYAPKDWLAKCDKLF